MSKSLGYCIVLVFLWVSFSYLNVQINVAVSVNSLSDWFRMLYVFDMLCFCLFVLLVGKTGVQVSGLHCGSKVSFDGITPCSFKAIELCYYHVEIFFYRIYRGSFTAPFWSKSLGCSFCTCIRRFCGPFS